MNRNGIEYSITLKQVQKYADQNNARINVYGWEDTKTLKRYTTKLYIIQTD